MNSPKPLSVSPRVILVKKEKLIKRTKSQSSKINDMSNKTPFKFLHLPAKFFNNLL